MSAQIAHARLLSCQATPRTTWLFVELRLSDGTPGWGEATLSGREPAVTAIAARHLPGLHGTAPASLSPAGLPFTTLPEAALSSAVLQAARDVEARRAGVPLADRLGGRRRDRIGLYANINRRTKDRTPEGFAASARVAAAAGQTAFKIAPFDEVQPSQERADMAPGLARIAAVRAEVGPAARLMIDCHWRFTPASAAAMITAAAPFQPYWIECPVRETPDQIGAICQLRKQANAADIRLAGLESQILTEGFRPYLEAGAYDVMMPDVKYAGGPDEMLAIAALFARHGVAFSPHNPSGPVAHAQSLQICAALASTDLLEHQFDETPLFDRLIGNALPAALDGAQSPDWSRPGIGVDPTAEPGILTTLADTEGAGA